MPKKIKAVVEDVEAFVDFVKGDKEAVSPLTETFGSGDLNLLKDKINEIIARIG